MNRLDDLGTYNGEHDSWRDFTNHENTSELSELFDDSDINQFIDNLNDWD